MRTAIYRHFASDGSLLYVGITGQPLKRLQTHMGGSQWAEQIANVTIEWHETRPAAELAERRAIRGERPPHNQSHAGGETVAEILDILGRISVAAECDIGVTAISNACAANRFPAKWFLIIRQMCGDAGIDCPEGLFSFIPDRRAVAS